MSIFFVIGILTICSGWSISSISVISAYDSGFDHGRDDAKIPNPDNRYINQNEKGPSFHSKEFLNGYDDGFDGCISNARENSNNNNDNSNNNKHNGIRQIPSKSTDFPHDDQNVLDILFAKSSKDSIDNYHVKGSIQNVGTNTLKYVKLIAHFYNINSNPIGVTTCCYAEPSTIEPGHTS